MTRMPRAVPCGDPGALVGPQGVISRIFFNTLTIFLHVNYMLI